MNTKMKVASPLGWMGGKRTATKRILAAGRVSLFFHLQRPPLCGCSAIAT
jgi:hypothetical protein